MTMVVGSAATWLYRATYSFQRPYSDDKLQIIISEVGESCSEAGLWLRTRDVKSGTRLVSPSTWAMRPTTMEMPTISMGVDLEMEVSVSNNESLAMEVGQVKGKFVDEKYHICIKRKSLQAVSKECRRALKSLSNCEDGTKDDDEDDVDKHAVNPQVEVRGVDILRDEEVGQILFNYLKNLIGIND
ncbi:hypothetical protein GQ457_16G006350 [Hibiscus cannabinus]